VRLEAGTTAFLEGKGATIVAFVDASGWPVAARGWGMTVLSHEDGRVRLIAEHDDEGRFDRLAGGGRIAVTLADVVTLRSCQIKGVVDRVEPVTEADIEVADHHSHAVFDDIARYDCLDYELAARMKPFEFVAIELVVDEVYDQTPGPGAGAAVAELPR
jgi:hypothetical protein